MPSIEKFDVPLEQATTTSLDALKAYSLGLSTWDQKGDVASIPFFRQAIEIDPNFAMAYGARGTVYHNLSEDELARADATKAYQLSERVTQAEKLSIQSWYLLYVTGDLEKAAQIYEVAVQNYPNSAGAFNHLGTTYAELGRYQNAVGALREALRLDPTRATTYANLAANLLALNQTDDAGKVLSEAERLKMDTDFLLQVHYWRAFLRRDNEAMQLILQRSEKVPEAYPLLLSEQANTEAYYGRFETARQLSRTAAELMKSEEDKEAAGDCMAEAAAREAEAGNVKYASEYVSQALQLTHDQNTMALAALALATSGDLNQALSIGEKLNHEYPSATMIQKYWLPTIRAEVDLRRGRAENAIHGLNATTSFESASLAGLSISTLYPAYVRGKAYLAVGDGNHAAAEFQKLIDNPGLVLNFPLYTLARLGRARAYSHLPDPVRTRLAYQDFLKLWKDADPDLPILRQARREYARMTQLEYTGDPHAAGVRKN